MVGVEVHPIDAFKAVGHVLIQDLGNAWCSHDKCPLDRKTIVNAKDYRFTYISSGWGVAPLGIGIYFVASSPEFVA
jgi:hypothetical protein